MICELRKRNGWRPAAPGRRDRGHPAALDGAPGPAPRRLLRLPAPERPAVIRYEWPCPGNLLHMDVKKFGKFTEPGHAVTGDRARRSGASGWEYCHSIVDDCSRLAYSELHDDERAETVTAFTQRALDCLLEHGVAAERLMTDNAFAYTQNRSLHQKLRAREIRHLRTRPYTPLHQRQSRTLPTDPPTRMGLRNGVQLKRSPPGVPATLGNPLQRAPHPQRARQPATPSPAFGTSAPRARRRRLDAGGARRTSDR